MATDDDVIERAEEIEFRLRCEAKHMTADLVRDLVAALRASRARVEELEKYEPCRRYGCRHGVSFAEPCPKCDAAQAEAAPAALE